MVSRDANRPPCSFATSFQQITQETIRLPSEISPEFLTRALERLTKLYTQLNARMPPFHYPSASGIHYCLRDAYEEGVLRVQNLAAFPVPKPAPSPARSSPVVSPHEVVNTLAEIIPVMPQETFLGEERVNDDTRHEHPTRGGAGTTGTDHHP